MPAPAPECLEVEPAAIWYDGPTDRRFLVKLGNCITGKETTMLVRWKLEIWFMFDHGCRKHEPRFRSQLTYIDQEGDNLKNCFKFFSKQVLECESVSHSPAWRFLENLPLEMSRRNAASKFRVN